MRRERRRWAIVLLLAAWVLLGPIGMAFDGCAAKMALCDGPCGVVSAVMSAAPTFTTPYLLALVTPVAPELLPAVLTRPFEPPPKHLSLSA
jgi:hypothetical protein